MGSCYHRNIVNGAGEGNPSCCCEAQWPAVSGCHSRTVDRVAIYEESPPNDADSWKALRIGLSALAGEG